MDYVINQKIKVRVVQVKEGYVSRIFDHAPEYLPFLKGKGKVYEIRDSDTMVHYVTENDIIPSDFKN